MSHLEHARDAGFASDSREMAVRDVATPARYGSSDFAVVVAVLAVALIVLLLTL
jgi:hypothetical protein